METDIKLLQTDSGSFFETTESSISADIPFTNMTSDQQGRHNLAQPFFVYSSTVFISAKGRINSQLPDLLNGTEIDRSCYFNSMGMNFASVQSAFGKHNGDSFADWDDKVMFQQFNKMKLEEVMQRDESKRRTLLICEQMS